MKITDLSQAALDRIKAARWDRIIEKHEGPARWSWIVMDLNPEFLIIDDRPVLLPIDQDQHPNITILRTIWSADDQSLTLFLKDTTYGNDGILSGFMAVCDRVPGESFYLAILYHEWFIIDPPFPDADSDEMQAR